MSAVNSRKQTAVDLLDVGTVEGNKVDMMLKMMELFFCCWRVRQRVTKLCVFNELTTAV